MSDYMYKGVCACVSNVWVYVSMHAWVCTCEDAYVCVGFFDREAHLISHLG
jgi:hypothetical protein